MPNLAISGITLPTMPSPAQIAVAPEGQRPWLAEAVRSGGATVVDPATAGGSGVGLHRWCR